MAGGVLEQDADTTKEPSDLCTTCAVEYQRLIIFLFCFGYVKALRLKQMGGEKKCFHVHSQAAPLTDLYTEETEWCQGCS